LGSVVPSGKLNFPIDPGAVTLFGQREIVLCL
jgi:hypothetical protein